MGHNRKYRDDLHYMKDSKWLSGDLCYWRDNPNYSEKTKRLLEKRMKIMCAKGIRYQVFKSQQG